MKIITPIVLFLLLGFQSKCIAQSKVDYIIYGTYYGECIGHCAYMFKLENDTLLTDTTTNFLYARFGKIDHYVYSGIPVKKEKYSNAKRIRDSIPDILLKSESKQFGGPDNRDQGGIYLEFKTSGKVKSFFIDTDTSQIPAELRNYVLLIFDAVNY